MAIQSRAGAQGVPLAAKFKVNKIIRHLSAGAWRV